MRVAGCLLVACLACACAKQSVTPQAANTSHTATTQAAQRIVSLAPNLTELIYAVGAESALVATVEYADYPAAAKQLPRVGDAFRVDLERLVALKPDLVLVWTSGTSATTVAQIQALGLHVVSIDAARLQDVSSAVLQVGELTGHTTEATQVAAQFTQGIDALRAQYADAIPLQVFVAVNRQPLYTINGQHLISDVLGVCGGVNVFADLKQLAPSVSVESVLQRNPQVMVSTDGTLAEVQADWHAWQSIDAVRNHHVYVVSPDTTTRATPRLLQGVADMCAALAAAR